MVISKINSNFAAQFSNCTFNIGIWCNGNTTDSGPVILGSSPSIPTIIKVFSSHRKHFFDFLKTASSPSSWFSRKSLSINCVQRRLLFMFFKCIILRCFKFFHRFVNHQTIDSGEKNMLSNTLFAIGFPVDELSWASTNSNGKRIKYEGTS